ncbi:MAG: hypothetical protein Q8M09_06845, partial [Pseudomonadota bacterium]|nr:hypothetical protein [Pseudomonadota bacterium]
MAGAAQTAASGTQNALYASAATAGKLIGGAGIGVSALALSKDAIQAGGDIKRYNYITDSTLLSMMGNTASAAAGITMMLGAPALVPLALVSSAVLLGYYGLTQAKGDTEMSRAAVNLLSQAKDLANARGGEMMALANRLGGGDATKGVGRAMSSSFLNFSFGLGNSLNRVESSLTTSLQSLFTTAQQATIPVSYAPPPKPRKTGHCPLVLDLDGDGLETVSTSTGAYFDHDANGFAELTGWAHKDDGLLVWDRNGNGMIDSGRELFGDRTLLKTGAFAADGYAALAEWDDNKDGRIDANDAIWANLKIWRDTDGDGYSANGELHALSAFGIQSLSLANTTGNVSDGQGNTRTHLGSYTRAGGAGRQMGDFVFQRDTARTLATEYLDVPDDIAVLPNLMGFGNMHDLDQAMVRDASGALKALVTQYQATSDATARAAVLEQLLNKWAGVDGIAANSRGGNVDARRLTLLEKFLGQDYTSQYGVNPISQAAPSLNQAYQNLADTFHAQIMA